MALTVVVVMASPNVISLIFSEPMVHNAAIVDPDTYVITPGTGAVYAPIIGVTHDVALSPTIVTIQLEGITDSSSGFAYLMHINAATLQSSFSGDWLPVLNRGFGGLSVRPVIVAVQPISATQVRVTFSSQMVRNTDIETASRYTWTGGLTTLRAEYETQYTVLLTTTTQTPGVAYDLTV